MTSSLSIIQGTNSKPVVSGALIKFFSSHPNLEGELFIGYPIIGTPEGRYPIDAIWVSPSKGVVIFDLIEGNDPSNFQERQDDAANKLEARLKSYRELVRRRDLVIPIHTVSFAPGIPSLVNFESKEYILTNSENFEDELSHFRWDSYTSQHYKSTLSALQNISTIRKTKPRRSVQKSNSRGAKLKNLEGSIATLDNLQGKAVIETVNGVQRIRGLAGSGKTIVLALKAAYLHAQHPDWKIAVTFNTRSLKGQFKRLINTFSIEQTGEEPDWNRLKILNAWGASGSIERDGIYHQFCRATDTTYFDFRAARNTFGMGKEFDGACNNALNQLSQDIDMYDAILVDEAQDFPSSFLKLCYEILDTNKRLVYAYDELQNLSGTSVAPPEDIFGCHADGKPKVTFTQVSPNEPRRDIILEKCYRNSRPILVTAHALGFGIYRRPQRKMTTGLVQMFDEPELWRDIGYSEKEGTLREGQQVVLQRTSESSPKFLEEHSDVDDLIQFKSFSNPDEQAAWVSQEIQRNIIHDELLHEDIVVINPDPLTTRKQSGIVRALLHEAGINSHLAGVDTDPDVFQKPDSQSITFTGIFRAKGNEAGMIYIINAQDCHSSSENLASIRNRLFTAITRSKAWVRVLGVGAKMESLIDEFHQLKQHSFELSFRYPTQPEREKLSIVHRDMTTAEKEKLQKRNIGLSKLLQDLESGNIHLEDLDEEILEKLKLFLSKTT